MVVNEGHLPSTIAIGYKNLSFINISYINSQFSELMDDSFSQKSYKINYVNCKDSIAI